MIPTRAVGIAKARRMLRRASRLSAGGRLADALPLARQASDSLRHRAAGDPRRVLEYVDSLIVLSDLHLAQSAFFAALEAQNGLVTVLDPAQGCVDDPDDVADRFADALTRRGDTLRLMADHSRAKIDLDRAVDLARSPLFRAGAHNASGILAKDTGRYDEASEHYVLALQDLQGVLGEDDPQLASLFHNLAGLEHARRRFREGEPLARRAIALRTAAFGPDSPQVAADWAVLGALLAGQERFDEAESIFRQTLATWINHRGPDHYEVAVSLQSLAALRVRRGDLDGASEKFRQALRIKESILGPGHPEVGSLTADLAAIRLRQEPDPPSPTLPRSR